MTTKGYLSQSTHTHIHNLLTKFRTMNITYKETIDVVVMVPLPTNFKWPSTQSFTRFSNIALEYGLEELDVAAVVNMREDYNQLIANF